MKQKKTSGHQKPKSAVSATKANPSSTRLVTSGATGLEEVQKFLSRRPTIPAGLSDSLNEKIATLPKAKTGQVAQRKRTARKPSPPPSLRRLETEFSNLTKTLIATRKWEHDAIGRLKNWTNGGDKTVQRRLLTGLSLNSLLTSKTLSRLDRWHAAYQVVGEAIRIRKEEAYLVLGASIGVGPNTYLQLAHTTFMVFGNSPMLRQGLKSALQEYPNHAGLAYWAARYHVMSAQFRQAFDAIQNHLTDARIRNDILPLLSSSYARSPEEAYPCNFYLYRYTLFPSDNLERAREALLNNIASHDVPTLSERLFRDVIDAWNAWNQGNADMEHRRYASAEANYLRCRETALRFFADFEPNKYSVPTNPEGIYSELVKVARAMIQPARQKIHLHFRHRYQTVTLPELFFQDWKRPLSSPAGFQFYDGSLQFLESFSFAFGETVAGSYASAQAKFFEKAYAPLLALALVHTSLALAESRRTRRRFDDALQECRQLLDRHEELKLLSQFIEVPFIKILMGQTLLERGDAEYKARTRIQPEVPDSALKAKKTYQEVSTHFLDQGRYVERVNRGVDQMRTSLTPHLARGFHPLTLNGNRITPLQRLDLMTLVESVPIETVSFSHRPGDPIGPHERLLDFRYIDGLPVYGETNPIIYQLVLAAKARLLQIAAKLNYLGYPDDYVPPWRFSYLIDRARYYTGHAKTTQSDYLNYLSNAEREEFHEQSEEQRVAQERQSVRTERARVDQSRRELEAAIESRELAERIHDDSLARLAEHDPLEILGSIVTAAGSGASSGAAVAAVAIGAATGTAVLPGVGTAIGAGIGVLIVGGLAVDQQVDEHNELSRAAAEAQHSAQVAAANVTAARARLEVSVCQLGTAFLRHDFAVQTLFYLRNRTFSAEMWYRLAHLMRSVADTYLRYAIELAFLSEQAYEFEADRTLDVIRFDYDVEEVAGMLAADFLSADLDTLEHDLIVTEQTRQQQLRFVVSLGRDFPTTLASLRESGAGIFTLTLEHLERRFPGLFNLRVGTVEVLPIALMDPTGFSLELTHMGDGQARLSRTGGAGSIPGTASWLSSDPANPTAVDILWPVRSHLLGPETGVYTGLTRMERDAASPMFGPAERNAFERRPAASSWRVDVDLEENRIVPQTFADALITFHLTGYYNATLRDEMARTPKPRHVMTRLFSGHDLFPDEFYDFNQSGVMTWPVTREILSLAPPAGELRNIGVALVPATGGPDFGNLFNRFEVEIHLDLNGQPTVQSFLPQLELRIDRKTFYAKLNNPLLASAVSWDFGDGSSSPGLQVEHTYSSAGAFNGSVRIETEGRLKEYSFLVNVSSDSTCLPPVTAFPQFTKVGTVAAGKIKVKINAIGVASGDTVSIVASVQGTRFDARGANPEFELEINREYVVAITVIRQLKTHVYSRRRSVQASTVLLDLLHVQTNRTFDSSGETNAGSRNSFAQLFFSPGAISPVDTWSLETHLSENPVLLSQDPSKPDFSQIQDAILLLQYEVGR